MVKHPEELGFKLGLRIRIGEPACITSNMPDSLAVRDVVYVALFAESDRPLKKGDAFRVGQTKGHLIGRWRSAATIFGGRRLKPNEKEDRRKWLEVAAGKDVEVWMKAAGKIEIPYAKGLTQSLFSTRDAEEEFLDQYYEPKVGKRLNRLATEETNQAEETSRPSLKRT
jgi:hypothetical protein